MIVVVASPRSRQPPEAVSWRRDWAQIASRGGRRAPRQVVGRVGEDPAGEGVLLDLAQRSVGHIAVLRSYHPTREEPDSPATLATRDPDAVFDDLSDALARTVASRDDVLD